MHNERTTNWIWTPDWTLEDRERARLVLFRRELLCDKIPNSLPIRITADCRYKLYVNGTLAQFGPAKGDNHVWYADQVELSPFLDVGKNVLAVSVLRYPENRDKGNHSLFRTAAPGLYVEGLLEGMWRCRVDRSTHFYAEEERFAPLWIHEHVASDVSLIGWQSDIYDDCGWEEAKPYLYGELPEILRAENLCPRPIPFMDQKPHSFDLPLAVVPDHSQTRFVLDAGEEMCAFLRLSLSGGKGAEIELLQSECYVTEQGKANRLDAEHGHLEGYSDTYIVAGSEREIYGPYWFRSFRFLQVSVRTKDEPLHLLGLDYTETGYPLKVKTSVVTSDPSLSAVWNISLRTLQRCMHETYTDCPFYEQLQYAMDTRSQILYTYAVSADDRLARQAIDDFSRAQRSDGLLNCSYPNVNVNVIPGFSIYFILMLHDHMMYIGDKAFLRAYLPTLDRILCFFDSHLRSDGLVDKVGGVNGQAPFWSFIDWAETWLPTEGMPTAGLQGPITMESLLYVLGLQKAAELCEWLGDEHAEGYRQRAHAVQTAIRVACMDETGMITDGPGCPELSQHAQVFGILTGTLSREEGRRNLQRSMEDQSIAQCTVAMCYYLFRAMEQVGLYEYTDRYWNIWRRMIANGCTTCVESEGYARSECHAWGALALYELPSVILGVRPAAPGYEKILVSPNPGYLSSASGTVHTPRGDLSVKWDLQDGKLKTEITCDKAVQQRIKTK